LEPTRINLDGIGLGVKVTTNSGMSALPAEADVSHKMKIL